MPTDLRSCRVCADPNRYNVESAYIAAGDRGRYSRSEIETHLSHTTSPEALRAVSDLASASAVAARLRQLEGLATSIIEAALDSGDGKLALQALREARATLVEMSKLSDSLVSHDESSERPDLDAAIAAHLGMTADPPSEPSSSATPDPSEPKALPSPS